MCIEEAISLPNMGPSEYNADHFALSPCENRSEIVACPSDGGADPNTPARNLRTINVARLNRELATFDQYKGQIVLEIKHTNLIMRSQLAVS